MKNSKTTKPILDETNRVAFALKRPPGMSKCRDDEQYRRHFVCAVCKKGFKGAWPMVCPGCKRDLVFQVGARICPDCDHDIEFLTCKKCPDCGQTMVEVDRNFRVPRMSDDKAWKEIRRHLQGGQNL